MSAIIYLEDEQSEECQSANADAYQHASRNISGAREGKYNDALKLEADELKKASA